MVHCSAQGLRRAREKAGLLKRGLAKTSFATFVWSLVVRALSGSGSLGSHLRTMSGVQVSDAAAQERRSALSWKWFEALFAQVLKPLAEGSKQPGCFHRGLRLLAVDGSQWSLRNTEAIKAQAAPKHGNQKGRGAAFFKFCTAVLVELGTHQPLAAACDQGGLGHAPGEVTLAKCLLGSIPAGQPTLLLADRLYGGGGFIAQVRAQAGPAAEVLLRVAANKKARVIERLRDGSSLVEVSVSDEQGKPTRQKLRLREVRGQVWFQPEAQSGQQSPRAADQRTEVRLWTTLLDDAMHPAKELLLLYAQRWEQELFFRELKHHVGREHLLRAGTLQGAQAEFGALIIAASLLAQQRLEAAAGQELPPVRLSLTKISTALAGLLPVLAVAGDLLSPQQRSKLIAKFMRHMAREARIPPRRSRSGQRGLRKPASAWPRIHSRCEPRGSWLHELLPTSSP